MPVLLTVAVGDLDTLGERVRLSVTLLEEEVLVLGEGVVVTRQSPDDSKPLSRSTNRNSIVTKMYSCTMREGMS